MNKRQEKKSIFYWASETSDQEESDWTIVRRKVEIARLMYCWPERYQTGLLGLCPTTITQTK